MLKYILCFSVCFFVIVSPAIADLTAQDLKEIRLIIKEEIAKELTPIKSDVASMKSDIATMKVDIVSLKEGFARLDERLNSVDKQFEGVDKQFESVNKQFESVAGQITHATNITYGLIALIVVAVGIPQVIMMWRDRRDSTLEAQIAALTQEVEKLKQQ